MVFWHQVGTRLPFEKFQLGEQFTWNGGTHGYSTIIVNEQSNHGT